jgi:hypothetical protein
MDPARLTDVGPARAASDDPREFSIVLGGPLYQLLRRAHVTGDALELVRRRIVVIAAVAWLPLLLLSVAGGTAFGGIPVPFAQDFQVHMRFLVAIPLMVAAELLVHMRIRPVAQEFLVRDLVPRESLERFHECVRSAFRWRNSIGVELGIVALVYLVGVPFVWKHYANLDVPATWYATRGPDGVSLTPAGYWYAYASVPLFQFLLLRWYYRMLIWVRFLWQVSRIELRLSAMHPDQAAGLGFLNGTVKAFAPLLMAHGAIMAGTLANRIFYSGGTLMEARYEIAGFVIYLLVLVLLPLTVFAGQVNDAKRRASREYGRLAQVYVTEFEGRWLPRGTPAAESPLGSGDIQSLADISNAMASMKATRVIPITRDAVLNLAGAVLLPIAPLLLTVIPAEELVTRLLKMLL